MPTAEISYTEKIKPYISGVTDDILTCTKPWGSRDEGLWCSSWRNSLARQEIDHRLRAWGESVPCGIVK